MPLDLNFHIQQAIKSNRKSQKILFDTFNHLLYVTAMKYLNHKQNAEEVTQEAWVDIFKGLERYQDQGKFEGWIKTIVIRRAWKLKAKQHKIIELKTDMQPVSRSLDKNIVDKLTCEEILGMLDTIPPSSRVVFQMFVIDGYKHHEIGEIIGISESTSRAHLSKARSRLKKTFSTLNRSSHAIRTI